MKPSGVKNGRLLCALPILALVFGCLEYGPGRGPELWTTHVLLSLALVFLWFWRDARARGYKASVFLMLAMLVLTVVALPYYLFRSRGLGAGIQALALSILVFAGTMVAYHVGAWFA